MTKQIKILLEIEENESIEDISKIIEDALNTNNISYIAPICAYERKKITYW